MSSSVPAQGPPPESHAVPAAVTAAPPSWRWRRAALLLAIAAQLITISDLVGADPVPATWTALLLAIGPAPLALAAAFALAPVNWLAAVAGVVVLVTGIAGQITHTGLFFLPALVALAIGSVLLWREQPLRITGARR